MKESTHNTLKDILHREIITKTKSTLHYFVSGVKNLFRHTTGNPEDEASKNINNYLKSPEEIEAEFRFLSASQPDNSTETKTLETPSITYSTINIETRIVEEALPDYMEENY